MPTLDFIGNRREALRQYLRHVVRSLVARGVVRKAEGQDWLDIVRLEPLMVLREIEQDVRIIGTEIGVDLFRAIKNTFFSVIFRR